MREITKKRIEALGLKLKDFESKKAEEVTDAERIEALEEAVMELAEMLLSEE